MSSITLSFSSLDNASLQIGDTAYYVNTTSSANFNIGDQSDIIEIGTVTAISSTSITCDISNNTVLPTTSSFILFSKDNGVNLSSLTGYYASVKFKNNSKVKAEMFAASCEVNESSK